MNGPAVPSSSPWMESIGWMLLHSLWQGAGVAMAMAVALCVLRRAPAHARYLVSCAAMILMVALPIATLSRGNVPHPSPSIHHDAVAEPAIVAPIGLDGGSSLRIPTLADRLEPMLPAIVALWMAGVGVLSLRLLGGWIQARRWVRHHTRPLADPWPARVERLKERLGIRRAVALLESARVEVPMVVGWLRPAVLVPVAALSGLSVPELEAILAHELAHVRRHDYLINLIQCVVEVVMFYHPATWWISRASAASASNAATTWPWRSVATGSSTRGPWPPWRDCVSPRSPRQRRPAAGSCSPASAASSNLRRSR